MLSANLARAHKVDRRSVSYIHNKSCLEFVLTFGCSAGCGMLLMRLDACRSGCGIGGGAVVGGTAVAIGNNVPN